MSIFSHIKKPLFIGNLWWRCHHLDYYLILIIDQIRWLPILRKKKKKLLKSHTILSKITNIYYENSSAACAEDLRLSSTWPSWFWFSNISFPFLLQVVTWMNLTLFQSRIDKYNIFFFVNRIDKYNKIRYRWWQ